MRPRLLFAVSSAVLLSACPPPASGAQAPGDDPPPSSPLEGPPPPAGASCSGVCPAGQICVESACRYRATSPAGELLAVGAAAQLELGDLDGALASFDQAIERYRAAEAPVPPDVSCGAALAALRISADAERREAAARRAYDCFRGSLPGHPMRREVQVILSRLRFDGLDLAAFDAETAPARFFALEPTRPTMDAIEIAVSVRELEDAAGYEELTRGLAGEAPQGAIATCFVEDWERRHERSVRADFLLQLRTRLRDMGDYDVYEPLLEVVPARSDDADEPAPFATCVATALKTALTDSLPRFHHPVSGWEAPFELAVRVQ